MAEETQKLLETETQDWVDVFAKQWEILKSQDPTISWEESVRISVRLRSLAQNLFSIYV